MTQLLSNNQIYFISKKWHHTVPESSDEKNIYSSLKFFLCASQFLGILPQEDILKGKDVMHFKWKSWKVAYSFFYIISLTVAIACCVAMGFQEEYNISLAATQVFYAGSLVIIILYLRLAVRWAKFNKKWCYLDRIMNDHYGYPQEVDNKIRLFSVLYLIVGVADHMLSVANRYSGLNFDLKENYTAAHYYSETFPQLFYYIEYSIYGGIYTSVITTHANLTWAFNDLFIIIMSILLASRFQQMSKKLCKEIFKEKPVNFWQQVRVDYDKLVNLCSDLDGHISYMIAVSYFQNLFFLLVQLYHSFESFHTFYGKFYFIYSFIYLLFKTGSVSLYAAKINNESKEPAYILSCIPSSSFNIEIKRLLVQINFDTVALTGCKMFRITSGLLLSVASAIVTYELVLVQFTSVHLEHEGNNNIVGSTI